MKDQRRLGKGLEDVSHLFLSAQEKDRVVAQKIAEPDEIDPAPEAKYSRTVAITADRRSLEKSFLVCNLAVELARRNRRLRILDADSGFPNQTFLWGLKPGDSLAGLMIRPDDVHTTDVVIDAPLGIKLLSLDIDLGRVATLAKTHRQHLLAGLTAFEDGAQMMLVDTPADGSFNSRLIFQLAHQIVVMVPSDPLGMIDAYTVIKSILAIRPTAQLGMIAYRVRMASEAQAVARHMAQAVSRFLRASIADLGFLYADLHIDQSISQRTPLLLASGQSRAARCLATIADRIWIQQRSDRAGTSDSFFAAMGSALEARP